MQMSEWHAHVLKGFWRRGGQYKFETPGKATHREEVLSWLGLECRQASNSVRKGGCAGMSSLFKDVEVMSVVNPENLLEQNCKWENSEG